MQSFTAMTEEAVQAVKAAQRTNGNYHIATAGDWTEDFRVIKSALMDYQDTDPTAEAMLDELHTMDGLLMCGEEFDVLCDALVARWEQGDDRAASLLSGIAETLGIEFI
jgi:hypothetical protein